MCEKICYLVLLLLFSNEIVPGKSESNTKSIKNIHKKIEKNNGKIHNERGKRSVNEKEKVFLTHMEQGLENEKLNDLVKYATEEVESNLEPKNLENEPPFWGTRGRRADSSSDSTEYFSTENKNQKCKPCDKYSGDFYKNVIKEELDPFWFELGVKGVDQDSEFNPFWGQRGRRSKIKWKIQDDDPPFWGNRGKRGEIEQFWGSRDRRDEVEPFWGNRGRRDEMEPFWGNRGRRDEMDPFWGNRGRRQEKEPFWGTRGRRETKTSLRRNPSWSNQEKTKSALKEKIINAMDNIKDGVEVLARMRRVEGNSFWNNRGRDSKLENLFKKNSRIKNYFLSNSLISNKLRNRPAEQNTVLDERMYAEQPHYILIERSSRSSAEDDPFFISRGKKYTNSEIPKGFRDRRGVLEDLVKTVRTDPYYIARGKKDPEYIKIGNATISKDEFVKAKELICSTIDLLVIKSDDHKAKRDIDESERDRRTILKKLAAQLQMDPYFVSRGKKNGDNDVNKERLEKFINHVVDMCN